MRREQRYYTRTIRRGREYGSESYLSATGIFCWWSRICAAQASTPTTTTFRLSPCRIHRIHHVPLDLLLDTPNVIPYGIANMYTAHSKAKHLIKKVVQGITRHCVLPEIDRRLPWLAQTKLNILEVFDKALFDLLEAAFPPLR